MNIAESLYNTARMFIAAYCPNDEYIVAKGPNIEEYAGRDCDEAWIIAQTIFNKMCIISFDFANNNMMIAIEP